MPRRAKERRELRRYFCESCRRAQPTPWIHSEATAAELAAHIRLRWLMERMQREARREDDHQHLPHW